MYRYPRSASALLAVVLTLACSDEPDAASSQAGVDPHAAHRAADTSDASTTTHVMPDGTTMATPGAHVMPDGTTMAGEGMIDHSAHSSSGTAAATADPHAGHAMPPPATAGTPAMDHSRHAPSPDEGHTGHATTGADPSGHARHSTATASGSRDAHSDHGREAAETADVHAGHAATGSTARETQASTSRSAAASHSAHAAQPSHAAHATTPQQLPDPHAAHRMTTPADADAPTTTDRRSVPAGHAAHAASTPAAADPHAAHTSGEVTALAGAVVFEQPAPAATLQPDAIDHPQPLAVAAAARGAFGMHAPVGTEDHTMHTNEPSGENVTYACPMHPEVTSDRPGTCPKCGMALEPVEEEQP